MTQRLLDFASRALLAADAAAAAALVEAAGRAPSTSAGYRRACRRFDQWRRLRGQPEVDDATLEARVGHLFAAGRAPATIEYEVAAIRRRARDEGTRDPKGPLTAAALDAARRAGAGRGRGPAISMRPGEALEVQLDLLAASSSDHAVADAALVGLAGAGLRSGEIAALDAGDVEPAEGGSGAVVSVRRAKANQRGTLADCRPVPRPLCDPVLYAAAARPGPRAALIGPRSASQIGRRFRAAVRGRGWSVHSGRRGMAAALAAAGLSDVAIMAAGGWRSAATVARYAASARAGDVARAAAIVDAGERMAELLRRRAG